jgi:hypothetical protein
MHRHCAAASLLTVLLLALGGCGAAETSTVSGAGTPRPGPAVDLMAMVPANASVVLHADIDTVRQDPARYDRIAGQLATELGLVAESATLRALLDRTEQAVGVFAPGADGRQEGMLLFTGRYSDADFEGALAIASGRHGGPAAAQVGSDGRRVMALGNATLVQFDTWTWAVVQGPGLRAHLAQVPIGGARAFSRSLIEFGPRIGLPQGSSQAWADQNAPVGVDMVGLVFAGENPQMVQSFVGTVRRHLGL